MHNIPAEDGKVGEEQATQFGENLKETRQVGQSVMLSKKEQESNFEKERYNSYQDTKSKTAGAGADVNVTFKTFETCWITFNPTVL